MKWTSTYTSLIALLLTSLPQFSDMPATYRHFLINNVWMKMMELALRDERTFPPVVKCFGQGSRKCSENETPGS